MSSSVSQPEKFDSVSYSVDTIRSANKTAQFRVHTTHYFLRVDSQMIEKKRVERKSCLGCERTDTYIYRPDENGEWKLVDYLQGAE